MKSSDDDVIDKIKSWAILQVFLLMRILSRSDDVTIVFYPINFKFSRFNFVSELNANLDKIA